MWPRSCTEQFLRTHRTDTSPKPRHHHPVLKRKLSLARFPLKGESLAQRNPNHMQPFSVGQRGMRVCLLA